MTCVDDGAEIQLFELDGCPWCIHKIEGAMVQGVTSQCCYAANEVLL